MCSSNTNKGKSTCMSLISYAFSYQIMVTLLGVFPCLQKVSSKNAFLKSIFAKFLVVFGPLLLYGEIDDKYPENAVSVTKKDIRDFNYQSIYNSL